MKGIIYFLSRIMLLDEVLGLAYWALSILGLILFIDLEMVGFWKIVGVGIYIPLIVLVYMVGLKKVKAYFKAPEQ